MGAYSAFDSPGSIWEGSVGMEMTWMVWGVGVLFGGGTNGVDYTSHTGITTFGRYLIGLMGQWAMGNGDIARLSIKLTALQHIHITATKITYNTRGTHIPDVAWWFLALGRIKGSLRGDQCRIPRAVARCMVWESETRKANMRWRKELLARVPYKLVSFTFCPGYIR